MNTRSRNVSEDRPAATGTVLDGHKPSGENMSSEPSMTDRFTVANANVAIVRPVVEPTSVGIATQDASHITPLKGELSVSEAIKLAITPEIEMDLPGPDWAPNPVALFIALPSAPTDFARIVSREIGEVAGVRVSITQYQEISDGGRDDGEPLITISSDSRDLDFDQMHALSVVLIEAQRTLGLITGRIIDSAVTQ